MEINADFGERVVVHGDALPWVPSPMVGVERRMLDRVGAEVARATTIVRYAPGSHFSPHVHGGGEEFLVLDGVFQDEHGDYPTGSYVRNPPTTKHTPGSTDGCVLFVKLWQFDPQDRQPVRADTKERVGELFRDEREVVELLRLDAGEKLNRSLAGGGELLIVEGTLSEGEDSLRAWSWLRVPMGGELDATAGPNGASVWLKTGHLRFVEAPDPSGLDGLSIDS